MSSDEVVAGLAAAGFEVGPPSNVRRTVLDTFDGRLHAAGLRLELRDGNGPELILSEGGALAAHVAISAIPSVGDDFPPGPFRARLAPVLGVRALLPLLTVSTRRSVASRRDGEGKLHVGVAVQDRVSVDGAGPAPLAQAVEIEQLQGYPKAADEARALLASLGLTPRDGDLLDVVAEGAGVDLRGHDGSPAVLLVAEEPARDGFRRVLARLADVIDENCDGAARAVDPEFLHDLRVAVRRTRSVLAQARHVVPKSVRARFREEFAWLGAQTGPARDLDVYVIEWDRYVSQLEPETAALLDPVLAFISARRHAEHATLAETLRSQRYRDLQAAWRSWLAAGGDGSRGVEEEPRDGGRPLGKVIAHRIELAHDQLVTQGRSIGPRSPATDLHELRKDAKKLRYLLECFGGLLAPATRKRFVQHLKALQDNLGEHQDTEVHAAQLRSISQDLHRDRDTTADTLLAMGQLTEHFEQRGRAAREEFSERFAAYDAKRTRRALSDLLASAIGE